jgi:spore maturation protein SpmB
LRIILPLSFAVSLLDWTGLLAKIGRLLAPAMSTFGLPGEAALALVSGWLVGIYGGVAAMAILPLGHAQVTILSLMLLTAHNLPVECTVQHKTGTPWWLSLPVRIATAAVLGWVCAAFLIPNGARGEITIPPSVPAAHASFGIFLEHWALSAGKLAIKILVILLGLMLVTEWMRAHDIYHRIARPLKPVLSAMGLAPSVAFLWITAMVLGLAYGSGLLMEEAREPGRYRAADLRDLNISIGICHSVLEDTALLFALGAGLLWITVPRFIAAAVVVRLTRIIARV